MDAAFTIETYTAEALVGSTSPAIGRTVGEIEGKLEGDVEIAGIVRERFRRYVPTPNTRLHANDVLLLRGEPADLEQFIAHAHLELAAGGGAEMRAN